MIFLFGNDDVALNVEALTRPPCSLVRNQLVSVSASLAAKFLLQLLQNEEGNPAMQLQQMSMHRPCYGLDPDFFKLPTATSWVGVIHL